MRVLLLGAGGFLGRHIWRELAVFGCAVVTAGRSDLPESSDHVRLDLAGTRIGAVLDEVEPDVVVNCAGATGSDPAALAEANVVGTANLVEAIACSVRPARLVHIGSAAEYGAVADGIGVSEQHPTRPLASYGLSKLGGSRIVEAARSCGLDTTVLRVFNPVGPGAPASTLLGRLATEIAADRSGIAGVRLGNLDAVRDFVDVRDVAIAVHTAVTARELAHPVFNVGSGHAAPVRRLVEEMVAASRYQGEIMTEGQASARSAGVHWQQADITLIREALGWRPQFSLPQSVFDLWEEQSGCPTLMVGRR